MIGRSQPCAIVRTIVSVNVPGWVEVPTRIVGETRRTTSSRPIRPSASRAQPATSPAGRAQGRWKERNSSMSSVSSPGRARAQIRAVASASPRPAPTMASRSSWAMPAPAVPAPKTTTRCSVSGTPDAVTPDRTAARLTAAVPWMSSLKVRIRSR